MGLLVVLSGRCLGQAVPDTSLRTVISDTAREARLAEPPQVRIEGPVPPALGAPRQPIPKKAALYSAVLPGAGQAYNRQWWKVPVIYAGVGTSLYFLVDNTNQYRRYRRAYLASLDPAGQDELLNVYSRAQLQTLQDAYRRYLDLTVLFTALGYTVQVLDALVFSHLRNFDVSKDISLRFQPVVMPGGAGVGLVMNFR